MNPSPTPLTHKFILGVLTLIAVCLVLIATKINAPIHQSAQRATPTDPTLVVENTAVVPRGAGDGRPGPYSPAPPSRPERQPVPAADSAIQAAAGQTEARDIPAGLMVQRSAGVLVVNQSAPPVPFTSPADGAGGVADQVHYGSVPNECKVRMDGTSTFHDWYAESGVIGGSLHADPNFPDAGGPARVKADANIPVRTFKSSGGRKMDSVMLENLKSTDHRVIKYSVIELVPKGANAAGGINFDAKGALTIAGVTRTNSIPVTISKLADNKIKVVGAMALKMTDYGVTPPSPDIPGLNLIKTGDEVKLKFEWVTQKAQ